MLSLATLQADTLPGFRAVNEWTARDDHPSVELMASQQSGAFRIEPRSEWLRRGERNAKIAPNAVRVKLDNATAFWVPGQGTRVEDGWLQGYDAGEFGGGLYWFGRDGKSQRFINGDNTQIVARLGKDVYAVQSLTHMMFWYSRLVRADRTSKGWASQAVTDLHVAPTAVVADGKRFLFATQDYISTLETDGRQHEVFRWMWNFQPSTMVRRDNGDVWLAGQGAALRLRPQRSGDYAKQWFLPLK